MTDAVVTPTFTDGTVGVNSSTPAVRVTARATDAASTVVAAEGFIDTVGADGTGFSFVPSDGNWNTKSELILGDVPLTTVQTLAEGPHDILVHAKDAAGNWGSTVVATLVIDPSSPPLYFSTLGNVGPVGVTGVADNADIYRWGGNGFSRVIDARGGVDSLGLPANANVDGFDRVDDTHFYMSFYGVVDVPGVGPVDDEDVVFYDAGTWSLFFNGSDHGLSATNLNAISVVDGSLYFSTSNGLVPPGAGGPGDDSDIYLWDGGNLTPGSSTPRVPVHLVGRPPMSTVWSGWTPPTSTCPT